MLPAELLGKDRFAEKSVRLTRRSSRRKMEMPNQTCCTPMIQDVFIEYLALLVTRDW